MGRPAMNETLAPIQSEHALLGAAIYDPEHCADVVGARQAGTLL